MAYLVNITGIFVVNRLISIGHDWWKAHTVLYHKTKTYCVHAAKDLASSMTVHVQRNPTF